jgi:uncharacterized membrane protein YbhN (UPF0104 family)
MWLGTLPFMGASFAAIRLQRLIDPYVKRLGKGASHAVVSIEHFAIHTLLSILSIAVLVSASGWCLSPLCGLQTHHLALSNRVALAALLRISSATPCKLKLSESRLVRLVRENF